MSKASFTTTPNESKTISRKKVKDAIIEYNKFLEKSYFSKKETDALFNGIIHFIKNLMSSSNFSSGENIEDFNSFISVTANQNKKLLSFNDIEKLKEFVGKKISEIDEKSSKAVGAIPEGYTYIQLPNHSSPIEIWGNTEWTSLGQIFPVINNSTQETEYATIWIKVSDEEAAELIESELLYNNFDSTQIGSLLNEVINGINED